MSEKADAGADANLQQSAYQASEPQRQSVQGEEPVNVDSLKSSPKGGEASVLPENSNGKLLF